MKLVSNRVKKDYNQTEHKSFSTGFYVPHEERVQYFEQHVTNSDKLALVYFSPIGNWYYLHYHLNVS